MYKVGGAGELLVGGADDRLITLTFIFLQVDHMQSIPWSSAPPPPGLPAPPPPYLYILRTSHSLHGPSTSPSHLPTCSPSWLAMSICSPSMAGPHHKPLPPLYMYILRAGQAPPWTSPTPTQPLPIPTCIPSEQAMSICSPSMDQPHPQPLIPPYLYILRAGHVYLQPVHGISPTPTLLPVYDQSRPCLSAPPLWTSPTPSPSHLPTCISSEQAMSICSPSTD